jgi:hypothetical protein
MNSGIIRILLLFSFSLGIAAFCRASQPDETQATGEQTLAFTEKCLELKNALLKAQSISSYQFASVIQECTQDNFNQLEPTLKILKDDKAFDKLKHSELDDLLSKFTQNDPERLESVLSIFQKFGLIDKLDRRDMERLMITLVAEDPLSLEVLLEFFVNLLNTCEAVGKYQSFFPNIDKRWL